MTRRIGMAGTRDRRTRAVALLAALAAWALRLARRRARWAKHAMRALGTLAALATAAALAGCDETSTTTDATGDRVAQDADAVPDLPACRRVKALQFVGISNTGTDPGPEDLRVLDQGVVTNIVHDQAYDLARTTLTIEREGQPTRTLGFHGFDPADLPQVVKGQPVRYAFHQGPLLMWIQRNSEVALWDASGNLLSWFLAFGGYGTFGDCGTEEGLCPAIAEQAASCRPADDPCGATVLPGWTVTVPALPEEDGGAVLLPAPGVATTGEYRVHLMDSWRVQGGMKCTDSPDHWVKMAVTRTSAPWTRFAIREISGPPPIHTRQTEVTREPPSVTSTVDTLAATPLQPTMEQWDRAAALLGDPAFLDYLHNGLPCEEVIVADLLVDFEMEVAGAKIARNATGCAIARDGNIAARVYSAVRALGTEPASP